MSTCAELTARFVATPKRARGICVREFRRPVIPFPAPPIDGIHTWLMQAAWWCRKSGMATADAVNLIQGYDGTLRRHLLPREAANAVEVAYSAKIDKSVRFERVPELPSWNSKETAAIYTQNGTTVADLIEASPEQDPASFHPVGILQRLFPDPQSLICVGESKFQFLTAALKDHQFLRRKQFVVPAVMTSVYGETRDGRLSMHCKSNTGPCRFIVCDFDSPPPEQHPAIIMHLAKFRPLTMVLSSGGKSLHAWFPATTSVEDDRLFWRLCIGLGADPAVYRNTSQFVRMPNGTRENGNPQSVVYFNPNSIPQP